MNVTAEHITRIADFAEARIDEQFTGDLASRHWDKDPVARSLRALRRVVQEIRSKSALEDQRADPNLSVAVNVALTYAWGELVGVAQQWDDHPDYLPEFALLAHQLEATP
ncbi:hypothetical protein ACGFNY_44280 [Streptomyces chartreusis]|uniref:hypothetical protein n=1 Tax=Streptomyces chartreusis TaxID=1969 RepID=UPI0037237172